jgi:hypothetical protein
MPFFPLVVERLGKIHGTCLQQENVSSDLDRVSSNNRRQKLACTRLHALEGARDPERRTKGQKAEWFAVVDFVLLTVSQNGTRPPRSAFPVTYRHTTSKDRKRINTDFFLKLVKDDVAG